MGLASEGKERPENNYGSREPEYSHQPAGPSAPSMELLHENFGVATRDLWMRWFLLQGI